MRFLLPVFILSLLFFHNLNSQTNELSITPKESTIYSGESVDLTVQTGQPGNALVLSGDQYIDIPFLQSYYSINKQTFAVDFWIKPEKGTGTLWAYYNSTNPSANSWELVLNDNSNFLFMEKRADGTLRNRIWLVDQAEVREQLLFDNQWHLLTINFGRLRGETTPYAYIYIDGEEKIVIPSTGGARSPTYLWNLLQGIDQMRVGADRFGNKKFKGGIEDFGYYFRSQTVAEIKERYSAGKGAFPVSLNSSVLFRYKLNESSGVLAKDESIHNNTAEVKGNNVNWTVSPIVPKRPQLTWSPSTGIKVLSDYKVQANPVTSTVYNVSGILNGAALSTTVTVKVISGIDDFRSVASGNWNDYTIWQKRTSSGFVPASPGEFPTSSNSVYLEAGHTVTVSEHASCKDLNVNTTVDLVRLNITDNALEVWGKLRLFSGAAPGANAPSGRGVPGFITTGTNGRIRLKGTTNRVITEKDEFSDHENLKGWTLECDLADGVVGTINSNFRAGNVIITSGNLEVKSKNFKVSK